MTDAGGSRLHVVLAGVVTAIVGFTSSFAVVLAGLRAVGATPTQAASGLMVLCLAMGLGGLLFSWRLRMPVTMAWSTPGAALLATAAVPDGGWPAAVGAFCMAGVLLALCGLVPQLTRVIAAIPTPLANAMLAGVLLHLCVAPVTAAVAEPLAILPVIAVWLALTRLARRWAVLGALGAAAVVMAVDGTFARARLGAPALDWTTPTLEPAAILALAVPLVIVTMTSQNIPGIAILASFGYRPPLRGPLTYAGAATIASARSAGTRST